MMISPPCPICGAAALQPFLTAFDRCLPGTDNYEYMICGDCGVVGLHPIPDLERIATFYSGGYHCHEDVELDKMKHKLVRPINQFIIRHYLSTGAPQQFSLARAAAWLLGRGAMKGTLRPYRRCRLLDVGCGNGQWLYLYQQLGWATEGIELVSAACTKARELGLTVHQGTLFDYPGDKRFDVITFNHVLEHVQDPVANLRRAAERLDDQGMIIIKVPNIGGYSFRKYGNCWYALDTPRHLFHFTPATLTLTAGRAGLKLRQLKTEASSRILMDSRHIRETIGPDYVKVTELSQRQAILQRSRDLLTRNARHYRNRRRLLQWPAQFLAWCGRGETILATFVRG